MGRANMSKTPNKFGNSTMGMKKGQGISKTTSLTAAERITRMREARKMYSKISQDRSKKPSPENTASTEAKIPNLIARSTNSVAPTNKAPVGVNSTNTVEFKSMKSSLDMIKNNNVRIVGSGRASSIAKPKTISVRPSLLPLGINVFEANHRDQQKVRDFLADRDRTCTPHNSRPDGEMSWSDSTIPCSSRIRNVRFRMEEAIQEQQESSDEVKRVGAEIDNPCSSYNIPHSELPMKTTSILKRWIAPPILTPTSTSLKHGVASRETVNPVLSTEDCGNTPRRESVPKRGILFGGAGNSFDLNRICCENVKNEVSTESSGDSVSHMKQQSENSNRFNPKTVSFTQCYSFLHQITRQEWRMVEPIMVDEVIELLKEVKENILNDVALQDEESVTKLASPLPIMKQDKTDEGKNFGFRQFIKKKRLGDDLMANQEVMLINQSANINADASGDGKSRSLRLRQKNPVATTLGGDSPFVPIVSVPSDHFVQISNADSTDEETFAPAGYSFAGRPPLSSSTPRPPHVVRSLFEDSVEDGG